MSAGASPGRHRIAQRIAEALGTEHAEPRPPRQDRRPEWLKAADEVGKASYDPTSGRRVGAWQRANTRAVRSRPLEPLPRGTYTPRPRRGIRKPPS
jgi:hypothetical protein